MREKEAAEHQAREKEAEAKRLEEERKLEEAKKLEEVNAADEVKLDEQPKTEQDQSVEPSEPANEEPKSVIGEQVLETAVIVADSPVAEVKPDEADKAADTLETATEVIADAQTNAESADQTETVAEPAVEESSNSEATNE